MSPARFITAVSACGRIKSCFNSCFERSTNSGMNWDGLEWDETEAAGRRGTKTGVSGSCGYETNTIKYP